MKKPLAALVSALLMTLAAHATTITVVPIFEPLSLHGTDGEIKPQQDVPLVIQRAEGTSKRVYVLLRIDTAIEVDYFRHGGILPFVLRQLMAA